MKDEIKQILEALKSHNDIVKEYPLTLSIEQQKLLLDYITNLQEEIERQSKAQVILDNQITEMYDYKSRCEKAIEYIKENWGHWCSNHCKYATETINILQGSDKQ